MPRQISSDELDKLATEALELPIRSFTSSSYLQKESGKKAGKRQVVVRKIKKFMSRITTEIHLDSKIGKDKEHCE